MQEPKAKERRRAIVWSNRQQQLSGRWKSFQFFSPSSSSYSSSAASGDNGGSIKMEQWIVREDLETFAIKNRNEIRNFRLTDDVDHVFVPLLQFTLYRSSFLNTTIIRTIRHLFKSNAEKWFSTDAEKFTSPNFDSPVTVRCDAKSTYLRNIDDTEGIFIWLFPVYCLLVSLFLSCKISFLSFISCTTLFTQFFGSQSRTFVRPLNWAVNLQVYLTFHSRKKRNAQF